jgi:hypothetical protein
MQPGSSGRNDTKWTIKDQAGRSHFPPCGATLMIAIRPEKLFEIIIGPREIRHRIAGKESGPVTPGDLPEVCQRWCQRAGRGLISRHGAQESPEAPLHGQRRALLLVAEDVGSLMDPAISYPYVGP